MNLNAAYTLIHEAMDKHGLFARGWKFNWDSAKLRFGLCSYGRREIKMSRALVLANDEAEVRDTILHEIAHALIGPGHGHGRAWKYKAMEVGARPERCYDVSNVKTPDAPYTATCKDCGKIIPRFKRPRTSMMIHGRHSKCSYKANKGGLEWRMRGVLMLRTVPAYEALPAPLWQRQAAHTQATMTVEAPKPVPVSVEARPKFNPAKAELMRLAAELRQPGADLQAICDRIKILQGRL